MTRASDNGQDGRRPDPAVTGGNLDVAAGLWRRCPGCGRLVFEGDLVENLYVCPRCEEHFPLGAHQRLALLAKEAREKSPAPTRFNYHFRKGDFSTFSFKCDDCANNCEVTQVYRDSRLLGAMNSRCGVWDGRANEAYVPR